ncbi:BPIB3 protein, partial [Galbula dea]|nr:BPIB3 protein [Galbula dea]
KMASFWAVFLLCSLLTPSQGVSISPLVAKGDVDEGVLGGLLDKEGVLGGLLGRDGVLDGLLGKDGLVDSLLDAVLDLLIGKGGLLSKDGLVGNLLGGSDGDVPGPKIINNTLPKITLRSVPGFGHQVGFNSKLLVESTGAPGKDLCVQVEADVDMLVQDKWAGPEKDQDCETVDINVHVRPSVPLLDQPLKSLLRDSLREVGCNIINTRLNAVSSLLGSGTSMLPLGALGDLPPFSILSRDSVQVDLKLLTGDTEGSAAATTQGPPLTATLLLATGRPPRLSLSQQALSALLESVQRQGAFNHNITSSMMDPPPVPSSPTTQPSLSSALTSHCPMQLSRILPGSLPLELHVWVAKEPVVALRDGKATATLKASIDVVSPALQSSQKPLFSLDADIILDITPSVSDGRLQASLALDSCFSVLQMLTHPLPLQVSSLTGWLKQVLASAYIPSINDASPVSVPLPKVLNTSLRNVEVNIADVRIT